ncbi:spermatid perinuclear RNA-binding protein isoform X1 [Tachysurus ichikawai]
MNYSIESSGPGFYKLNISGFRALLSFWFRQRSIRSFGNDDRHVMAKHSTIYPSSEALEAIQSLVSTVECALKHVSDWMDQSQAKQPNQSGGQEVETEASTDESTEESTK